MKTINALILTIFVIVLTTTLFGQLANEVKTKTIIKQNDISGELGKPVFEKTVDSLNTKVWILTQEKYKELMKTKIGNQMDKMKGSNMKIDKETKEAMLNGTHYFIFDVTNITNKKEFADTSAKVEIVSPSKIVSSVRLQPMMDHFGGGVSLNEKGEYLFTINLNVGLGYKTTQFKYELK